MYEVTVYVEATPSATKFTKTFPEPAAATVGVAKPVPGVIDADSADATLVSLLPLGVTENS
jgi:hypothetical protein